MLSLWQYLKKFWNKYFVYSKGGKHNMRQDHTFKLWEVVKINVKATPDNQRLVNLVMQSSAKFSR